MSRTTQPRQPRPTSPDAVERRARYYRERLARHGEGFGRHAPSADVLLNLIEAYHACASNLGRFVGSYGISMSALNLLTVLMRGGREGCALGELSELMLVTPANITGLVDSLARRGLVERVEGTADRRVRLARLTAAGETLLESILPAHYRRIQGMFAGLDEAEMTILRGLLARLGSSVHTYIDRSERNGQSGTTHEA